MQKVYCKYCGKYRDPKVYSKPKGRCDICERHAKDRFDLELEIEMSCKADHLNNLRVSSPKPSPPASQELINKRRQHQERLDLQAIENEYM
jgi:hypothetical protein